MVKYTFLPLPLLLLLISHLLLEREDPRRVSLFFLLPVLAFHDGQNVRYLLDECMQYPFVFLVYCDKSLRDGQNIRILHLCER